MGYFISIYLKIVFDLNFIDILFYLNILFPLLESLGIKSFHQGELRNMRSLFKTLCCLLQP